MGEQVTNLVLVVYIKILLQSELIIVFVSRVPPISAPPSLALKEG